MRIALISHTTLYWTELYARFLSARGHEVRVISFSREPLEGIEVDYVGSGTPTRLKAVAYLSHVRRVRALLRSFAPDVVLATYVSSNGLVAALSRAEPLLISAHGSDVLAKPGGSWLHTRMMRFACRRASIVHAVSQPIADALIACGAPSDRMRCFPIGIDTEWFSPPAVTPALGQPARVVCTRNQAPVYGNETLVAALGSLRDEGLEVYTTMLGGGPLLAERRAQVKALELEPTVSLPGHVTLADVRNALHASDIYVSASWSDGASSSLLEAMACGLFPVVSAIPANTAWIEDGSTGLLFAPGDAPSLAAALRRAVLDEPLRASARERNRERVLAEGNLDVNMAKMEQLLLGLSRGEVEPN
jgi:L-malate glycosyltransferase